MAIKGKSFFSNNLYNDSCLLHNSSIATPTENTEKSKFFMTNRLFDKITAV